MMDISDLIRHLEDEKRTLSVFLENINPENMTRQYFYNQGKLTEINYIIKLLKGMLQ